MNKSINFNPPIIAHRGASAYAPENTMASFVKAAQLGMTWIEFDVMQTADGVPIIFHDDQLDRTTNAQGEIIQFPYSYLNTLDAGKWFDPVFSGEKIPTLETVIELLNFTNMSANIELKGLPGHDEELVKAVLEVMKPQISLTENRILFSSFSIDTLRLMRKYAPQSLIGLLLHKWEEDWQTICESLQCVSVHVNHEIMTLATAHTIKKMEKLLLCYTVNDPERARELYSWGVDAIFSDVPDKIAKSLFY